MQNAYNKLQLVRQQEISRNTLLTQEKERQRIGLELHDDLGPTFAAICVNLKRIRTFIKKEDFTMADEISKETSLALKEAVSNFSEISRVLYPVIFNRERLPEALHNIIERYNENMAMKFSLDYTLGAIENELTKLVIYMVFQEMTTNAVKHSAATKVHIDILDKYSVYHINYRDNGVVYDSKLKSDGIGLQSIKGRVEAINGSVDVKTAPQNGVTKHIKIPI